MARVQWEFLALRSQPNGEQEADRGELGRRPAVEDGIAPSPRPPGATFGEPGVRSSSATRVTLLLGDDRNTRVRRR